MSKVVVRDDGTLLIKEVAIVYQHLDKPWGRNATDKKKYSGMFLLPKDRTDDKKAIDAFIAKILKESNKGEKLGAANYFFRDGANGNKEALEEFFTISASENPDYPPKVFGRGGKSDPVEASEIPTVFYNGAIVNVLIRPWFQNNQWGKKLNANLLAVQYVKKGAVIEVGGGSFEVDDDVFESISDEFDDADDI